MNSLETWKQRVTVQGRSVNSLIHRICKWKLREIEVRKLKCQHLDSKRVPEKWKLKIQRWFLRK